MAGLDHARARRRDRRKLPPGAQWFYDWAGGLIWIALPPSDDGGAATIRRAAAATGGHATLMRAPAATRAAVDVFEPQPARSPPSRGA